METPASARLSRRLLGALHYLWLVKADTREPMIYLVILITLLAFRLPRVQSFRAARPASANASS